MSCSPYRPSKTPWSGTGPWAAPISRQFTGAGAIEIGWVSLCSFARCAIRGGFLRSGELIPAEALRFVADQVDTTPEALAAYAARFQTRYEQLDALRTDFGFADFAPQHRREILVWLLPIALATTSATTLAATLMDELRRRRLIVPGAFIVDQLVLPLWD